MGVRLSNSRKELYHYIKKLSYSKEPLRQRFKELLRPLKYKGYTAPSVHRHKFVIQNFVNGLGNDWKVLVYGEKFFVVRRPNRANDFRASGSGKPKYKFGKNAEVPDGMLDFAYKVYTYYNVPMISLDIAYKDGEFYLIEMQFVAFGNTTDKERRTSRYETRTYLRFLTGMDDWTIRTENIAAQFGDLSNLKAHGLDMTGYSAYLKNIYLTGFLSDKSGDSWFDSATGDMQLFNRTTGYGVSFRNGILRFGRIDPAKPDTGTDFDELMQTISSTLETLGRINSDKYVSPVEKSFLKERLQDIRTEYEQLRANALRLLSVFRYRSANGKVLMVHGKRRTVRLLADKWTPYEDAYQRAVAAIGKYTQPEPEFIPIEDDFADIEAYYTARRTIGALLDEAAKSDNSDLEYLRENFQDISTEIDAGSGVVLSGFVGVKDDTDKKVVAGMAGCALKGAPASKHGKLMFFAGADGIENAATAATRIYEDGHVEMASGIFSGYSKVQFKYFTDEGTDYNASTRKYTLNRNFNLIANGADFGSFIVWLNLPVSAEYIGSVVTLYDCPIRTRSSPSLVLAADDTQSGIVTTLKKDAFGMGYLPVPRIEAYGGLLQLLAVPSPYSSAKCMWHVTYQMMSEFKIYEE